MLRNHRFGVRAQRDRQRSDPRNELVHQFAKIVSILEPRGFLVENVIGLKDMNFVGAVTKVFARLGYTVTSMVLRSANYGVPQLLHRIVFIGDKEGRQFEKPACSHEPTNYVTVWDAIGDLPRLNAGDQKTPMIGPRELSFSG